MTIQDNGPAATAFGDELSAVADRPFEWSSQARPLSGLRTWTNVGLVATLVASVLFVIASAGLIYFEGAIDPLTLEPRMDGAIWSLGYNIVIIVGLVALPVYLLGFIVVAIFHSRLVFRATKNLALSKAKNIEFSPSWAVWVHFIPFISFWMPIGKVGRIWAASHAPTKPTSPWPAAIGWWWGLFVGSNILANLSFRFYRIAEQQGDFQTMTFTYWLDIVSWSLTAISCLLLMRIHREIDAAQQGLQSAS